MAGKWFDNLKNILICGNVGKCPFCGSVNTDYKCSIVQQESRNGYMDIWCNDCNRAFHLSRMQVTEDMKTDGSIPEKLKY